MADSVVIPIEAALTVRYETTEEQIAELALSMKGVVFDTPENYKDGVKRIAQVRGLRTAVEKRRKELKADSLAYGKRVDAAAQKLTDLIEAIENPLLEKKKAVDDEEERLKKEKERADLIALEAKLKADREAAEAAAKVEREADEKRVSRGGRQVGPPIRYALTRQTRRSPRCSGSSASGWPRRSANSTRSRRRSIAHEAEIDRQAKEAEQAEKKRLKREEAERQAVADAEAARVEAARLEAMKPIAGRSSACAASPTTSGRSPRRSRISSSPECQEAIGWAAGVLAKVANGLEKFNGRVGAKAA